ncbi:MAG: shikimate dehydrogenase, partial [Deltaproteobacteria bacterium]|nr:shikimate dehydrogenase [Deltaproteobacteria bacterium]
MRITGQTKITGIFGDPVGHTLSPSMHNAAFEALGLDWVYVPFHVRAKPASSLKEAVFAVRSLDMAGVNVTIPHKEKVIRYLDDVDEAARHIGAVNTIVNRDGRLVGHNTDGAGYLLSLREETGFIVKGKNIVVIGAGGAARAVLYSILAAGPSSVVIANRTIKRADTLAAEFRERFKAVDMKTVELRKGIVERRSSGADLLVNTTSLGMTGFDALDIGVDALSPEAVVSDAVYRPLETGLLRRAREQGLKIHCGLGMLVRQGALSFELWTGEKAPLDVMRKAAL